MRTTLKLAVLTVLMMANVFAASTAAAHGWAWFHWNRFGPSVTLRVFNFAQYRTEASRAIADWDSHTLLSLPQVNYHADISVYDGNFGNTGWAGLASIESRSGWHITHAHSRVNLYYGLDSRMKQGVHCQEIGHAFGLDHSNDGGCMGMGYWYGTHPNHYTTVNHNWLDLAVMYRNTHH